MVPFGSAQGLLLGREEGLGRRPKRPGWSLAWELGNRTKWQAVMDAREAHALLQDPYWEDSSGSQVWKTMAMLSRGLLEEAADWQDAQLAWQYVVDQLGREHGDTLLGEAFPLPKRNGVSWPCGLVIHPIRGFPTQAPDVSILCVIQGLAR